MKTKRALAAAITRFECKHQSAMTVELKEYWLRKMEIAQDQLDCINREQNDED